MSHEANREPSRRDFLRSAAAASALTAGAIPAVHAAGADTLQVALIGCGGRGTGAAGDALSTSKQGPIVLTAMADVFDHKLKRSTQTLKEQFKAQVDVPPERQFLGFDAYKKALDCLKKGDIAILTTPPAFRWVMFSYAIEKGLNVFMEKPVTVDGPTTKRMFKLAEDADKKNLKVGVGLMVRHCRGRQQLAERIKNGEIGDLLLLRGYRMHGQVATCGPYKPGAQSEIHYQISRFHSFLWASGGVFSDFNIHQIDELSWMKGGWPVRASATGGRHYRGNEADQNFDNYTVEYTYADGSKFYFTARYISNCDGEFTSWVHGTKGCAIVSSNAHTPGRVRTFKGQTFDQKDQIWAFPQPEPNPYRMEWVDLVEAIRGNKPYNEAKRGAEASLVTSMGRMAAHVGKTITYDAILNGDHEFAPDIDKLTTPDSPAPLKSGPDGKYPVPMPGQAKGREY
jgi:hypothetical protein